MANFWDTAKRVGAGVATGGLSEMYYNSALKKPARTGGEYEGVDKNNFMNPALAGYNQSLGQFADERGGGPFRGQQQELGNMLMAQARGDLSYSGEKLRQDTSRMQAMQQSMANSAGPANKAMAIRNAQMNAGQVGVGMAGQAALAGIQERTSAAQAAGGVLGGARGQDINAYLGAQQQMGQNAATQLQGTMGYEQNRTSRYGAAMGVPTYGEVGLGALTGLGGLMAGKSDKNMKKNIEEIELPKLSAGHPIKGQDPLANLTPQEKATLDKQGYLVRPKDDPFAGLGLSDAERATVEKTGHLVRPKMYAFEYKDGEGPKGKFVGPMAQDVEKVAPQAVINTSGGKLIDYAKAPVKMFKSGLERALMARPDAKPAPGLAQRVGQDVGPKDFNVVDMSQGSLAPALEKLNKLAGPRVVRVRGNTDLSTDLPSVEEEERRELLVNNGKPYIYRGVRNAR